MSSPIIPHTIQSYNEQLGDMGLAHTHGGTGLAHTPLSLRYGPCPHSATITNIITQTYYQTYLGCPNYPSVLTTELGDYSPPTTTITYNISGSSKPRWYHRDNHLSYVSYWWTGIVALDPPLLEGNSPQSSCWSDRELTVYCCCYCSGRPPAIIPTKHLVKYC